MTTVVIRIESNCGDAPGYVREGLDSLGEVGEVVSTSDLYRVLPPAQQRYGAIATLETALDQTKLSESLRVIEKRYERDRVAGDQRPLAFELFSSARRTSDLHTQPDGAVHISGTAMRIIPPVLDYDSPGGAGTGYDDVRPLSPFSYKLFVEAAGAIELHPGMRILDVGCGTGRYSVLFAQAGAVVVGLDRSTTMLSAARNGVPSGMHERLDYICADANEGLPAQRFDAVTFFMSTQYIALTSTFWRSLRQALVAGGAVAFITLPHRHFIENEFLTVYFPSIPRIDLARFPSIPRLERLLHENDFCDVAVREVVDERTSSGDDLIRLVERKFVSTLHLLGAAEFERGLAAMRSDISGRSHVRRTMRAAIVSARARPVQ